MPPTLGKLAKRVPQNTPAIIVGDMNVDLLSWTARTTACSGTR